MLTQIKNLQWATKAVKNAIFKRLFYFKSFVWEGEGRCFQEAPNENSAAKCLNTFVALFIFGFS